MGGGRGDYEKLSACGFLPLIDNHLWGHNKVRIVDSAHFKIWSLAFADLGTTKFLKGKLLIRFKCPRIPEHLKWLWTQ